jgi:hypothetical protein
MNYACQHCNKVCSVSTIANAHTHYNKPQKTFDSTDTVLGIDVCTVCKKPTSLMATFKHSLLWWQSAMIARKILFRVASIFL